MKKAGLRLLHPCLEENFAKELKANHQLKGETPMNANIMAYPANAVKTQNPTGYQRRVVRDDLSVNDLAPTYRSMARHIGKQLKRKQSVRIPAMNNQALGQLLRCLELRRSWV